MNWPKISVITPSYNQGKYIEDTIKSVINQDYPNLEYIIIDGGSTDETIEIIKKYEHKIHYWCSEKDNGQTDALIKGFNLATGDIYCWLNSDDIFEPNTLKTVAQFFIDNPEAEFVYGNAVWIDENSRVLYERKEMPFVKWVWLYTYNYIPQPSTFWKSSLYRKVGGLDPKFTLSMDGDLFARFSNYTHLNHIPVTLSRFRYYKEQRNQKFREKSLQEDRLIISRELGREPTFIEMKTIGFIGRIYRWIYRNIYLRMNENA